MTPINNVSSSDDQNFKDIPKIYLKFFKNQIDAHILKTNSESYQNDNSNLRFSMKVKDIFAILKDFIYIDILQSSIYFKNTCQVSKGSSFTIESRKEKRKQRLRFTKGIISLF